MYFNLDFSIKIFVLISPMISAANNFCERFKKPHTTLPSKSTAPPLTTKFNEDNCIKTMKLSSGKTVCISNNKMNFDRAKGFCESLEAKLATSVVRNLADREEIQKTIKTTLWIGLTDTVKEGEWFYIDGNVADKENTDWTPGEPNNYGKNENCAVLWVSTNMQFNDFPCENDYQALCENKE